jgi:class 3 adenylate cyclase
MENVALKDGLSNATLGELVVLYNAREESGLGDEPDTCAAVAQRALSLGEPLLAYDACRFALKSNPAHHRLQQLQGLALARCGALDQAREVMERLYHDQSRDEETLGILGRIHKDLWQQAISPKDKQENLRRALSLYQAAYQSGGSFWSGVNAATLALVSGQKALARELATKVKDQCASQANALPGDIWRRASLGEAMLVLGDIEAARAWYVTALDGGVRYGDRASMRRNGRLALQAAGTDPSWLDRVIPSPAIAVFSGHRLDDGNRSSPRFPADSAIPVSQALRAWIDKNDVQIGYGSAASGGDILFHEAMLDLGREIHLVLPQAPEQFARESVASAQPAWFERFRRVLERAASVTVHSSSSSGDIGYVYNNWMILGLARLRARQIEGHVKAMALWDGTAGLPGGTSTAVQDWLSFGENVEWLPPAEAASREWRTARKTSDRASVARTLGSQRIVSMLFADAVGFSKLPDACVPAFVEQFLGTVAAVLDRQPQAALTRNTWGDGLYFSFSSPLHAGAFALELCEVIRGTDWTKHGLPGSLSLRVALHCGPAHEVTDPVIKQRNFTGAHVSRAARIEPVTPPGHVYASQSFAALCECEGITQFACEYVGRMPLAKKYGEYPTYSVRRR